MSAIVISKLKPRIFLVSDRRSVTDVKVEIENSNVQFVQYHDNVRKVYFFSKQIHAFVAVSSHGSEPIGFNVSDLMSKFEGALPNQRLHIKEYAERLSTFLVGKYPKASSISQKYPSTFNVVGYDVGNQNPQHYEFKLPDIVDPYLVDATVHIVGDLKREIFESAKDEIGDSVRKRLEGLANTKTKLDAHEQKGLKALSQPNWDPLPWMNEDEHLEFAKNVIRITSEDLTQADEVQSVGTDTDVVVISPRTGVDPLEYGEDDPTLSETATHFISVECCDVRQKFQLDEKKPLRDGYITIPVAGEFVCDVCGNTLTVSEIEAKFDLQKTVD